MHLFPRSGAWDQENSRVGQRSLVCAAPMSQIVRQPPVAGPTQNPATQTIRETNRWPTPEKSRQIFVSNFGGKRSKPYMQAVRPAMPLTCVCGIIMMRGWGWAKTKQMHVHNRMGKAVG